MKPDRADLTAAAAALRVQARALSTRGPQDRREAARLGRVSGWIESLLTPGHKTPMQPEPAQSPEERAFEAAFG